MVVHGSPLSVTFFPKMERDVARPFNPIFYRRYVDDIYNRRKINKKDDLYEALNKYHKNIGLAVEKSPSKFLDTKLIKHMKLKHTGKKQRYPRTGVQTSLKGIREMQFQ